MHLWNWIVGLFAPKPAVAITEEQKMRLSFESGECPDCGSTEFYEGPSGGICTNYECANCHSRFNIGVVGGSVIHLERI